MWLQIFAFVALVGYHRACGHQLDDEESSPLQTYRYGSYYNSFPYHYITTNKYTSAVTSYSSGPLCSGLHVSSVAVITVASCVFRHNAEDLFVISRPEKIYPGHLYEYLKVLKVIINPEYDPHTGAKNIALLLVAPPLRDVPIVRLPSLTSSATQGKSQVHINRFSYDTKKTMISSHLEPVEAKLNLNECTEYYGTVPYNNYYCVNLVDKVPYSYGMFDLGTSLTYSYMNEEYILGIFTGTGYPSFNVFKKYYLYESISPFMEFITANVKPGKRSPEDDYSE